MVVTDTDTSTPLRVDFDEWVDELVDDHDIDPDEEWWCVRTSPWPCPAAGCDFVAMFLTAAHRIVVWPRKDDTDLLRRADEAKQVGRDPEIVRYQEDMGPYLPYDLWRMIGRPLHGKINPPAGYRTRF